MPCFSLLGEMSVSRLIVFLGDIVVNGILSLLIKKKFPGLVQFGGTIEPAYTWAHYAVVPDTTDRDGRCFIDKAQHVKAELWVSLSRTTLLNTSH